MKLQKFTSMVGMYLLGASAVLHSADVSRPDLTGQITNQAGVPIPNGTVMVVGAGPRKGENPLCPYCYPDCGKKAVSDAQGNYRIESLDPSLNFYIMAFATGYAPASNSGLLPEAGPVTFKLKARDLSKVPERRHASGRLINPEGAPVIGAILSIEGVEAGSTTYWGGRKVDSLAVTDENGEYHITAEEDFDAVHAQISAPAIATRWAKLESGKTQLVRMKEGTTVQGRLVSNGKPMAGVNLGMSTLERQCGEFLSGFQATTDPEGRFAFRNMPAKTEFSVFGLMESFKGAGAAMWQKVATRDNGQPTNLGDIEAKSSHRLIGRLVLADGNSFSRKTRILLSRQEAWDHVIVETDERGHFEITGLPEEKVAIYLTVPGHRLSRKNPNLDSNHSGLIGRVTGDLSNFTILLEPGKTPNYDEIDRLTYEETQKRNEKPLQGVE